MLENILSAMARGKIVFRYPDEHTSTGVQTVVIHKPNIWTALGTGNVIVSGANVVRNLKRGDVSGTPDGNIFRSYKVDKILEIR